MLVTEEETAPTHTVHRAQEGHSSECGREQATEEPCIGSRSAGMAQQGCFPFQNLQCE